MKKSPYKMRGFPGFGNSPLREADAALVETAGTADDEAYETMNKMSENIAEHIASVGEYSKKDSTKKPPKKKKGKGLGYFLAGPTGRANMDNR
tara:strand:- start:130 stop:408 length:279 start_codon:yes stop_codon:yes gene_type:complete